MEVDEIEMTKEELQQWIRTKVRENKLISTDVQEKCNLLESLLERRRKQAVQLRKLCESVAACEAIVRKQYSLLGWEYPNSDDDDDDDKSITGAGNTPPYQCEFKAEPDVCSSPTTNGHNPLLPKQEDSYSKNLYRYKGKYIFVNPKLKPVVVLIRPPPSSLRPPTPQTCDSDDESFNSSDSSTHWEPDEDSDDSDDSVSSFESAPKKRRRIDEKLAVSRVTPQASTKTGAKSNKAKTSAPQASDKSNTVKTSALQANDKSNKAKTSAPQANDKSNTAKTSALQANDKSNTAKTSAPHANDKSNKAKTSAPQANVKSDAAKTSTPRASVKSNAIKKSTPQTSTNTKAKSNTVKTSTPPANAKGTGVTPVDTVSTPCQFFSKVHKPQGAPSGPQGMIRENTNVLARRKAICWQQGKITEIVQKENGKLKYKVNFENGKSLVSGHHIAFDCMPKANKLSVGTRVVIKTKDENPRFCPGIVAEVPSRKNRLRFLVFLDDLTPVYVGLPLLYLVYRPLADPLDDIPDENSKKFLKEYIESWPYPPQTQYKVGQMINVELNGSQKRCEVLVVDSSIIQVLFQKDQCKEWIYRGSPRLEHMIQMRANLELKKEEEQRNKSTSLTASSKSAH